MIVDAHLHLFRGGYKAFASASPLGSTSDIDAYETLRLAHGIAGGLVVCYEAEGIDPGNNAYVRELALTRPWISSVAYLDPSSRPGADTIEQILSGGHLGIAVYLPDAAQARQIVGWPAETWERLDQARAVLSLNARPEAIAELAPLIERYSYCSFLFSHLGLPGRHETVPTAARVTERTAPLLRIADLPNVGVKISGLYAVDPMPPHLTAQPFLDLLVGMFSPSNLHWGSDFSPALEFLPFEETLRLPVLDQLPGSDRDLIYGGGLTAKIARVVF